MVDNTFGWSSQPRAQMGSWPRRHALAGWVIAGVLLVGVIVSVVLSLGSSPSNSPSAAQTTGTPLVSTSVGGWTRVVSGVPIGYADNQAGATAAATNYLLARSTLAFLASNAAVPMAHTMDASAFLGGDLQSAQYDLSHGIPAKFGVDPVTGQVRAQTQVVLRPAILSTTAAGCTPLACQVKLWNMDVTGSSAGVTPGVAYSTETVSVVWQADDWKYANDATTPGPTPSLAPGNAPSNSDSLFQQGGV